MPVEDRGQLWGVDLKSPEFAKQLLLLVEAPCWLFRFNMVLSLKTLKSLQHKNSEKL